MVFTLRIVVGIPSSFSSFAPEKSESLLVPRRSQ
jgi:hypothetical protein